MEITALRERDQLLELGLDRLGLGLGGPDPLVRDDLFGQVHQQRLAGRRVTRQLGSILLVAHIERTRTLPANYSLRSPRPRACRVSITSSIDFLPKFGIAASSDSDFDTKSPTVWMPARFRQLYERTPSSSSSIRMSSIAFGGRDGTPPTAPAPPGSSIPGAPASRSSTTRSASVKMASCEIRISAASRRAACGSIEPSVSMSSVSLS